MSLRDHVICDSDLHVMEPPDLWQRYIDPAYAHAAPRGLSEMPRDMRVRVKNHTMLRMGTVKASHVDGRKTGWREEHDNVYAESEAAGWSAESQIAAMDAEGLDMAVLYPSPRSVRARPRQRRADRTRRPRAGVRHRDRARVQRLDEGLL